MNSISQSGEFAQGKSHLVCLMSYYMQGDFKTPVAVYQTINLQKDVQRNITNFLKASITTDSMKIFSITFCTLVIITVYRTCIINSERHFQNCGLRYNFLHAALRCSSFCLKTVICLWLYVCSWYVQFFMLVKDSVFVLWINKPACKERSVR